MPALAPPVTDERDGLAAYVAQQLDAFRAVAHGLTDEQARSTPTPSSLSVGALLKHASTCSAGWVARIGSAPEPPPPDDRSGEERMKAYADDFVMREDETLEDVLARFDKQAEETLRVLREADPDTPVPVPHDAPWFPRDVEHWSVRWVALPDVSLDGSEAGEQALLTGPELSYLRPVWHNEHWQLWEVRDPTPLTRGPVTLKALDVSNVDLQATISEIRLTIMSKPRLRQSSPCASHWARSFCCARCTLKQNRPQEVCVASRRLKRNWSTDSFIGRQVCRCRFMN